MNGTYCGCGDDIGVPCAGRDLDVIVAVFLFGCLSEDVAGTMDVRTRVDLRNVDIPILGRAHKSGHSGVVG